MGAVQTPLSAAMKLAQKPRAEVDQQSRIGLAWMSQAAEHGDIVWHGGQTGGYAAFIGFSGDGSRGVVILTNASAGVEELGLAVLSASAPLTRIQMPVALPASELSQYEGSYQLAENFILKVFRNGDQLYAQATNQGAIPIFPSAQNEFFAKVSAISISFKRGADGTVTGLILHQNGDRPARKLSEAETPGAAKETQLDAKILADYPGKYLLAPGVVIDVTVKDGQMQAQLTGQEAVSIYPSAKDKFFYKIVDAQLDFERNANGEVVAAVLHQNGRDLRARKLGGAAEPREVQLDANMLGDYPGRYQLAPGVVIEVTLKDGQVKAQLTGQEAVSIYPGAKDKFFYKIVDAQLDFERDGSGKVIAAVLHQNGRDLRALRIAP
jgi:hypothetical protein